MVYAYVPGDVNQVQKIWSADDNGVSICTIQGFGCMLMYTVECSAHSYFCDGLYDWYGRGRNVVVCKCRWMTMCCTVLADGRKIWDTLIKTGRCVRRLRISRTMMMLYGVPMKRSCCR
jgi:hypothetical protein